VFHTVTAPCSDFFGEFCEKALATDRNREALAQQQPVLDFVPEKTLGLHSPNKTIGAQRTDEG